MGQHPESRTTKLVRRTMGEIAYELNVLGGLPGIIAQFVRIVGGMLLLFTLLLSVLSSFMVVFPLIAALFGEALGFIAFAILLPFIAILSPFYPLFFDYPPFYLEAPCFEPLSFVMYKPWFLIALIYGGMATALILQSIGTILLGWADRQSRRGS
jgi:hypothetical protein